MYWAMKVTPATNPTTMTTGSNTWVSFFPPAGLGGAAPGPDSGVSSWVGNFSMTAALTMERNKGDEDEPPAGLRGPLPAHGSASIVIRCRGGSRSPLFRGERQ